MSDGPFRCTFHNAVCPGGCSERGWCWAEGGTESRAPQVDDAAVERAAKTLYENENVRPGIVGAIPWENAYESQKFYRPAARAALQAAYPVLVAELETAKKDRDELDDTVALLHEAMHKSNAVLVAENEALTIALNKETGWRYNAERERDLAVAENERLREALKVATDALKVHASMTRDPDRIDPDFCPEHAAMRLERVKDLLAATTAEPRADEGGEDG